MWLNKLITLPSHFIVCYLELFGFYLSLEVELKFPKVPYPKKSPVFQKSPNFKLSWKISFLFLPFSFILLTYSSLSFSFFPSLLQVMPLLSLSLSIDLFLCYPLLCLSPRLPYRSLCHDLCSSLHRPKPAAHIPHNAVVWAQPKPPSFT